MSKFTAIPGFIMKNASRGGLILRKHAPTILIAVGIVGVPVAIVLACRATLTLDAILDESKKEVERIKDARDDKTLLSYTENDAKKDLIITYAKTSGTLAKAYAPAAIVTVISVSCLLGSHVILKKRNLAIMAAYKVVDESFKNYRAKVIEEYGSDKDRDYRLGVKQGKVIITEIDAAGKESTDVIDITTVTPSEYSRVFDETNPQHTGSADYDKKFLILQERYANQLLQSKGHLFLNQVYENLGFEPTPAGQMVGWVTGEFKQDGRVSFGMYDFAGENGDARRDFINMKPGSTFLDFNVDGVIYDLL